MSIVEEFIEEMTQQVVIPAWVVWIVLAVLAFGPYFAYKAIQAYAKEACFTGYAAGYEDGYQDGYDDCSTEQHDEPEPEKDLYDWSAEGDFPDRLLRIVQDEPEEDPYW